MSSNSKPVQSTALVVYRAPEDPLAEVRARIQRMVDLSLQSHFAEAERFQRYWNGKVVVLVGASSAGKSTLIAALKKMDSGMAEEGPDLTGANFIYQFMEKEHQQLGVTDEDWQHLHAVLIPRKDQWHVHEAVGGDHFDFKPEVSEEDQTRAMRTARALHGPVDEFIRILKDSFMSRLVIDKALEHAIRGENTVFDIPRIDEVNEHPISHLTRLQSILVYCPFDKMAERLAERNRKALSGEPDLSEVRAGAFPLLQYSELVRPRQRGDRDSDVIDRVTRKKVEDDFNIIFDAGIEILKRTSDGRTELQRMERSGVANIRAREKKQLLTAFGFTESSPPDQIIELVPRKHYDMRVDTSDPRLGSTPAERAHTAAQKILALN